MKQEEGNVKGKEKLYKRVSTNDCRRDKRKEKRNEEPVLHSECGEAAEPKEENI